MADPSPLVLELDADVKRRVEHLASDRRTPVETLVQEALLQFVEREERGEQFRRDAVNAWAEYESSGLHATAGAVDAWLSRLANGEDAAPPECHS